MGESNNQSFTVFSKFGPMRFESDSGASDMTGSLTN